MVITNVSLVSMPELPYEHSDSVLSGTVLSAQSFRAGTSGTIYTEFGVSIKDLLSTNAPAVIQPNTTIAILQLGGSIKLEDGRTITHQLNGTGKSIEVGKTYLFFLHTHLSAKCAQITKTWDITAGKATPMNEEDLVRARRNQSEFAGMDANLFLTLARREAAKRKPLQ